MMAGSISQSKYTGVCTVAEAELFALDQLGASACGVTAVLSASCILKITKKADLATFDSSTCILRRRKEDAPLPQYLESRFNAGCTGQEVADSFNAFTQGLDGRYYAEFLPYKSIRSSLYTFLVDCFKQGFVVIATMNLQIVGNDAWHHQLLYGLESNHQESEPEPITGKNDDETNVFAMNPLCKYPIGLLERFVSTPSVLLIRREDILSRIRRQILDNSIYNHPLWLPFNVEKQIQQCLLDASVDYVMIPAAYVGGFTVIRPVASNL